MQKKCLNSTNLDIIFYKSIMKGEILKFKVFT